MKNGDDVMLCTTQQWQELTEVESELEKKYGWRSIDALKASDAKIDIYMKIYKGTMGAVFF